MSDSLRPHELQHSRLLCPPLSPRVCSNSCPLGWWSYPTVSSSVTSFSSCLSHIYWKHPQVPSWVKLLLIVQIKQYWEPVNYNSNFCSRKILFADLPIEIYIWILGLTDLKSGNDLINHLILKMGFRGGSDSKKKKKKSYCNAENLGSVPGLGRSPGEENGYPLLLAWKFHGQRSLMCFSPWGHKESDTTEWLTLSLFSI